MPELPEVNTLALALDHHFRGDTIVGWQIFCKKLRRPLPSQHQAKAVINKKIVRIFRRAKSIYFAIADGPFLHVHLGMTGYFKMYNASAGKGKHEHLHIRLKSEKILGFFDPRKFAVVELLSSIPVTVIEPVPNSMSVDYLKKICQKTTRPIKNLLMDQGKIAGIGNIYASESLFKSGILPDRPACSLSKTEVSKLYKEIISVIKASLKSGIASLQPDYEINEETTHFPIQTLVYGRHGQKCCRCPDGIIERMVLAGRSSFFCACCQK